MFFSIRNAYYVFFDFEDNELRGAVLSGLLRECSRDAIKFSGENYFTFWAFY